MLFFNVFFRTLGFLFAITIFIALINIIFFFIPENQSEAFSYVDGNKNSDNTIAILNLNGPIISNNSNYLTGNIYAYIEPKKVKKMIKSLNNKNVKALIIKINSPGGTVSATVELANIIKDFKNNKKVKIYFFTEEILASGGYWVATQGNKIFAKYGSVIGSIGVSGPNWYFYNKPKSISYGLIGQSIETEDGVEVYSQNAGDSKDLFNPFRKPKIQELNHLQKMVEEIYNDFAIEVSKTRKIELDRVKKNIGALIYTSNQAKENFLIDDVLNFNQLLNKISKEQNMLDYKIIENKLDYNMFEKFFLSKKSINICDKMNNVLLSVSPTYLRNCFIN